jgi:3-hydroxyacyl-[acyl-carrier-protein] dehydratase
MMKLELPLQAGDLMPQAGPMLLLEELLECDEKTGSGAGRSRIRDGHLFLAATGCLDAAACVEMLAQLCAAVKGYQILRQGKPICFGYLVGLKDFQFHRPVRAGEEILLTSQKEFEMEALSITRGTLRVGGEIVGEGTLKLYEPSALPPHPRHPDGGEFVPLSRPRLSGLQPARRSRIQRDLLDRLGDVRHKESRHFGTYRMDAAFSGFEGHFPDYPLQPGVATLEMGLALAGVALGAPLEFLSISQAKFSSPVFPNEVIEAEVHLKDGEASETRGVGISARIRAKDRLIASYQFTAGEAP